MRIVYLHQYFRKPTDNGSNRTYEMARRLAVRGHDVHVVSSSSTVDEAFTEQLDGFSVHWLPVPYDNTMGIGERLKSFVEFALRSSVTGRMLRGDVVFATSTPLTIAIPGIASTLLRRSPLVFEVRDLWPAVPIAMGALGAPWMRALAHGLEKIAYTASTHVVALSPDMKDGIVATGVPAEKVTIIPNASDNELFAGREEEGQAWRARHDWLGDRPMVFYGGTIGKVNDVGYLVRLAARLRSTHPEVRIVVVGTGNEEQAVRAEALRLGVEGENVFFLPPVPKFEVLAIFAAADVSVSTVDDIPVLAANSANKVFDSFAAGTPVVINHEGWLADLLRASGAGLVLSPQDLDGSAQRLGDYVTDREALRSGGRAARRLAVEQFDRQMLADRLAEVLEAAAGPAALTTGTRARRALRRGA
ncbi:glycosyltransferase family 4 protein [Micrococcus sp. TA1]|uniref:glycosyltransferase family 4 protein n=1 Tax=Micrococcus sp. TA1 TaxID=681627 RepID=UPI00160F09D5|nr:glycosyltransferase family 4 protein [Micrococcus sp. TA1]MBB5749577.1 glycosyltransferase involved in cell wall biosynthesis [Micrococcus sp. TA1]